MGTLPNPFAAPAVQGLPQRKTSQYIDVGYTVVFDINLLAGQFAQGLQKVLPNDADFVLRAMSYGQPGLFVPVVFNFRIFDWQNYYLSDGLLSSANISGDPFAPTPVLPEMIFPRGSFIGMDVQNLDPINPVAIQFAFRGVKRYRVGG